MAIRKFIVLMMLLASFLIVTPWSVLAHEASEETADDGHEPVVMLDEEVLDFENPVVILNSRLMVSIRHLAETVDGEVEWNEETDEVRIHTPLGEEVVFRPEHPFIQLNGIEYRMDVAPVTVDQRIYVPLRHAAEFLHLEVEWDEESLTANLMQVEPYEVSEDETLDTISEQFGITVHLLAERNQLEDTTIEQGDMLMVVIPDIMAHKIPEPTEEEVQELAAEEDPPYTEEELMLLAKITMVEAGYESYEGQLAVANVILNRVEDPRFPDTIRGVIYAPNQFPPAHNGMLNDAVPNDSVMKAAEAALSGEDNVEGALYFHNPNVTSGGYWDSLTVVATIGNHRFLK